LTVDLFVSAPRGLASLLAQEVRALGAGRVSEHPAGVSLAGTLELALQICLWSRVGNRVLLTLARFPAGDADALYEGVGSIDWREHLSPSETLAVEASAINASVSHTRFAAQRVKDAVVDQFRARCGQRPSVDPVHPDLRINLHLQGERAILALDLSGESLHRRGYRDRGAAAPLKENLAAAVLMRAQWPAVARAGGPLVDPMCGSGTLLVEGALMAADVAPGLLRRRFGFERWPGHDASLWARLVREARERAARGVEGLPPVLGRDADAGAVTLARAAVVRAGLEGRIRIEHRALDGLDLPHGRSGASGLVVVNPPYGERLGDGAKLGDLYAHLGTALREEATGWRVAVLTGNPELGHRLGLRAHRVHTFWNGAIECRLLRFVVQPHRSDECEDANAAPARSPGAEMFTNRLLKNQRRLARWARREGIRCYRVYDADMPEYALALDLYQGQVDREQQRWAYVQEYAPPGGVDPHAARRRLREALAVIRETLSLPRERVFLRVRRRQRRHGQYQKLAEENVFHTVMERDLRFLVNFTDYLDTGLFLEQRETRALIRRLADGRRFLNLFAYTGAATVAAAAGGAAATTSVDLSRTYLDWARRNLALNGFAEPVHELVQADCLRWLADALKRGDAARWDLVLLGPPVFSTSKRMHETLDVQRDHVRLIEQAARLLAAEGVLLFCTSGRRFRMQAAPPGCTLEEISAQVLPPDFARHRHVHRCWRVLAGHTWMEGTSPR
jgi:23S rRNA (guanine2445-N2)-methyltransferase / 23S rRNA (guanine2069-N7)-methyltransferase